MPTFEQVPIQEVQRYWDSRPCNIRHSPKRVGTKAYFDEVEARKYFVEPHIPVFADFPRWSGKRVLELGCGIGTDTINFARAGAKVTAVDLSLNSLDLARQRARTYDLEGRIRFYHANGEELSDVVPIEPYDLVYSFGVIHHTPHPERVVQALRHYLTAGGTLKVMVYHRYSWKALWILMGYGKGRFWKLPELVAKHSEAQSGCQVTYTYSRKEGRRLLTAHGFHVTDMQVHHIFPYRFPDYAEYRYRKVWYFRWMPKLLFRALEQHFGWHLCLTAKAV